MNDPLDFYHFIIGVAIILSALGVWLTAIMPSTDRWSKQFFMTFFITLLISCLFGFIEIIMYSYPVPIDLITFISLMGSLFLSLLMSMPIAYLLHCCGENLRSSKLFHIVLGLWAIFATMQTTILFSDVFYHVAPENENLYLRGPWFPLMMLPLTVIILISLACTIQRRNRLSRKVYLSFLITLLPMTITILVHMFVDIYPLIDICAVLSVLSMYGLILSDQLEHYMRQQWEIANQRNSIMVLQMRPHFIYNTMTSIYCLCGQNPKLARQVIMDFTTYLRKNFTAVASSEPIPFTSELEHTRAYLAVEQAQYEDSLFVDYDTPHTCFRVPPLTLQPIVENAIKHGRDPYVGPFRISIRTRKTDSGSEIIVEDNGRGFDPADDSEPHIALANIGQRLKMMSNGEMMIIPRKEGGTTVKVTIPRQSNQS